MNSKIFYGKTSPFYNDATYLRYQVFAEEQQYNAEIDIDSIDGYAWHIVCYDQEKVIGTARLYENINERAYSIGRVAVKATHRGKNIGAYMMNALMDQARSLGRYRQIVIHSQLHAIPFYEKLGFMTVGEQFIEEGQPHITMMRALKIRGFEIASGFESYNIELPHRKTTASAGYDLTIIEDITLQPKETILAKTGLKAYMCFDEVLEIYIRSSIAYKQHVWCINNVGIIDADYYGNQDNDGHIMIPLYNGGEKTVTFKANDRLAQGIFKKYLTIDEEDDVLTNTVRQGGFGSTN